MVGDLWKLLSLTLHGWGWESEQHRTRLVHLQVVEALKRVCCGLCFFFMEMASV